VGEEPAEPRRRSGTGATRMSSSTGDHGRDEQGEQNPEELRRDIEVTREEMGETLEALGDKLSPQRELERRKEQVRTQVDDVKSTVTEGAHQVQEQVGVRVDQARTMVAARTQQAREAIQESGLSPQRLALGAGGGALLALLAAVVGRRSSGGARAARAATAGGRSHAIARSLHDLGLAAWFGGNLMGALGLNAASAEVARPEDRIRMVNAGWGRWTPVSALAIGAHLLGALRLSQTEAARLAAQRGAPGVQVMKTALTAGALGATAYSVVLQQRVMHAEMEQARRTGDGMPVQEGTAPSLATPDEAADAQEKLRVLQWVVPGLTGALIAVSARASEQQRFTEVASGIVQRLRVVSSD
jgi:hypothetical protein